MMAHQVIQRTDSLLKSASTIRCLRCPKLVASPYRPVRPSRSTASRPCCSIRDKFPGESFRAALDCLVQSHSIPRWLVGVIAPVAVFWALPTRAMEMADEILTSTNDDLDTSTIVLLLMVVVAVRLAVQGALKDEEEQDKSRKQQPDNSWQDMTKANVRTVVDPSSQQQGVNPSRPIMSMYDMEKSSMATAAARRVGSSVREARRQIAALKIEQKLRPGLMNDGRQLTGYPGAEYLSMMMDGYLTTTKSNLSRQILVQQLSDQALGQCVLRMVAEIAAIDQVNCLMQAAHKTEKQSQSWVRSAV